MCQDLASKPDPRPCEFRSGMVGTAAGPLSRLEVLVDISDFHTKEIVLEMPIYEELAAAHILRCLHCRESLTSVASGLRCLACDRKYPIVAGIPILVDEPIEYLRSEVAFLNRAVRDAKRRRAMLDKSGRDPGLTKASIDRHRDVIDAELARAATFLALMEPVAKVIEAMPVGSAESRGARRSGWTFDSLLPYLLRDWTGTAELQAANSLISAALKEAFPNPSDILVVLAGCGAGGLLAEISPDFGHVVGFDLTLPVLVTARHLLDGNSTELVLPRAINELGRMTLHNRNPKMVGMEGIPRLINAVCDNLLLTAFALESKTATLAMLDEVTSDMRLEYPGQRTFRPEPGQPHSPASRPI